MFEHTIAHCFRKEMNLQTNKKGSNRTDLNPLNGTPK